MNGWRKHFTDGTCHYGPDGDERTSWSKSRLDYMTGVDLEHRNVSIKIQGPGQYWQSDTMEVIYPEGTPTVIQRRIEKLVEPQDHYFSYRIFTDGIVVSFNKLATGRPQMVPPSEVGKWFILELDVRTGKVSHYFRSERV